MRIKNNFLRFVSAITAILFTFNTVAWSQPAAIHQNISQRVDGIGVSGKLFDLALPEAMGTVASRYASPVAGKPVILHIQDAHSSYQAQLKISEILSFLNQKGIDLVFLEGAAATRKIEGSLVRHFKNDEANLKVADRLAQESIFGGAELYLADRNHDGKYAAYGVENEDLYFRNVRAYADVVREKAASGTFLDQVKLEIDKKASAAFNKDLKSFFHEWMIFQDEQSELVRHIDVLQKSAKEFLKIDLSYGREQLDWPQLVRVIKLQRLEKETDFEAASKEEKRFMEWVESQKTAKEILENARLACASLQKGENGEALRSRLEKLYTAISPLGFKYENYPALTKAWAVLVIQGEINSQDLLAETEKLNGMILGKLAVSVEEKSLVELYSQYLLLKKLFSLELSREEYAASLKNGETISPAAVAKKLGISVSLDIQKLFGQALDFYRLVTERDQVIYKNMSDRLASSGKRSAVLITGGFHTSGLQEHFKQDGISYLEVMPHISEIGGEAKYIKAMLGSETSHSQVKQPGAYLIQENGLEALKTGAPSLYSAYTGVLNTAYADAEHLYSGARSEIQQEFRTPAVPGLTESRGKSESRSSMYDDLAREMQADALREMQVNNLVDGFARAIATIEASQVPSGDLVQRMKTHLEILRVANTLPDDFREAVLGVARILIFQEARIVLDAIEAQSKQVQEGDRAESRASLAVTLDYMKSRKVLAGIHEIGALGMTEEEKVEKLIAFISILDGAQLIPEIKYSPEALEAIRRYHAEHPETIIAVGEIKIPEDALKAAEAGARILVASVPLDAAVKKATETYTDLLIISGASTAEQVQEAIKRGYGVKIKPGAKPEVLAGNLKIIEESKGLAPVIGLAGGVTDKNIRGILSAGDNVFVGRGIDSTTIEDLRKEADLFKAQRDSRAEARAEAISRWEFGGLTVRGATAQDIIDVLKYLTERGLKPQPVEFDKIDFSARVQLGSETRRYREVQYYQVPSAKQTIYTKNDRGPLWTFYFAFAPLTEPEMVVYRYNRSTGIADRVGFLRLKKGDPAIAEIQQLLRSESRAEDEDKMAETGQHGELSELGRLNFVALGASEGGPSVISLSAIKAALSVYSNSSDRNVPALIDEYNNDPRFSFTFQEVSSDPARYLVRSRPEVRSSLPSRAKNTAKLAMEFFQLGLSLVTTAVVAAVAIKIGLELLPFILLPIGYALYSGYQIYRFFQPTKEERIRRLTETMNELAKLFIPFAGLLQEAPASLQKMVEVGELVKDVQSRSDEISNSQVEFDALQRNLLTTVKDTTEAMRAVMTAFAEQKYNEAIPLLIHALRRHQEIDEQLYKLEEWVRLLAVAIKNADRAAVLRNEYQSFAKRLIASHEEIKQTLKLYDRDKEGVDLNDTLRSLYLQISKFREETASLETIAQSVRQSEDKLQTLTQRVAGSRTAMSGMLESYMSLLQTALSVHQAFNSDSANQILIMINTVQKLLQQGLIQETADVDAQNLASLERHYKTATRSLTATLERTQRLRSESRIGLPYPSEILEQLRKKLKEIAVKHLKSAHEKLEGEKNKGRRTPQDVEKIDELLARIENALSEVDKDVRVDVEAILQAVGEILDRSEARTNPNLAASIERLQRRRLGEIEAELTAEAGSGARSPVEVAQIRAVLDQIAEILGASAFDETRFHQIARAADDIMGRAESRSVKTGIIVGFLTLGPIAVALAFLFNGLQQKAEEINDLREQIANVSKEPVVPGQESTAQKTEEQHAMDQLKDEINTLRWQIKETQGELVKSRGIAEGSGKEMGQLREIVLNLQGKLQMAEAKLAATEKSLAAARTEVAKVRDYEKTVQAAIAKARPGVVDLEVYTETAFGAPKSRAGAGVIVDKSGLIITNSHNISSARSVWVNLHDGTRILGEVLKNDANKDLALIKINTKKDLTVLDFNEEVKLGQTVMAIGNPFGFKGTTTRGTLTGLNRVIDVGPAREMKVHQTDAGINPGNSGGALINLEGEVVGINVAMRTGGKDNDSFSGMGFTIPAATVTKWLKENRPKEKSKSKEKPKSKDTSYRYSPRGFREYASAETRRNNTSLLATRRSEARSEVRSARSGILTGFLTGGLFASVAVGAYLFWEMQNLKQEVAALSKQQDQSKGDFEAQQARHAADMKRIIESYQALIVEQQRAAMAQIKKEAEAKAKLDAQARAAKEGEDRAIIESMKSDIQALQEKMWAQIQIMQAAYTKETPSKLTLADIYKKTKMAVASLKVTRTSDYSKKNVSGSAFFVKKTGRKWYLATNDHVAEGALKVAVVVNGEEYAGRIVYQDGSADLAIVEITAPEGKEFTILPLDEAAPEVGAIALTIGNPYGYQGTLTPAVISALNRDVTMPSSVTLEGLIQFSAAVDPGNSGGALMYEKDGSVVVGGVVVALREGSRAISFAIPASSVRKFLKEWSGEKAKPKKNFKLPSAPKTTGKGGRSELKPIERRNVAESAMRARNISRQARVRSEARAKTSGQEREDMLRQSSENPLRGYLGLLALRASGLDMDQKGAEAVFVPSKPEQALVDILLPEPIQRANLSETGRMAILSDFSFQIRSLNYALIQGFDSDREISHLLPMAISPDGRLAAFVRFDQVWNEEREKFQEQMRLYILEEGETNPHISTIALNNLPERIVFSPDNKFLALYDVDRGLLLDISNPSNPLNQIPPATFRRGGRWTFVAFSRDSHQFAMGYVNGSVHVRYIEGENLGKSFVFQNTPEADAFEIDGLSFSPDGKHLAVAGWNIIHLWRIESDKAVLTATIPQPEEDTVHNLAWSPAGDILAVFYHHMKIDQNSISLFYVKNPAAPDYLSNLSLSTDPSQLIFGQDGSSFSVQAPVAGQVDGEHILYQGFSSWKRLSDPDLQQGDRILLDYFSQSDEPFEASYAEGLINDVSLPVFLSLYLGYAAPEDAETAWPYHRGQLATEENLKLFRSLIQRRSANLGATKKILLDRLESLQELPGFSPRIVAIIRQIGTSASFKRRLRKEVSLTQWIAAAANEVNRVIDTDEHIDEPIDLLVSALGSAVIDLFHDRSEVRADQPEASETSGVSLMQGLRANVLDLFVQQALLRNGNEFVISDATLRLFGGSWEDVLDAVAAYNRIPLYKYTLEVQGDSREVNFVLRASSEARTADKSKRTPNQIYLELGQQQRSLRNLLAAQGYKSKSLQTIFEPKSKPALNIEKRLAGDDLLLWSFVTQIYNARQKDDKFFEKFISDSSLVLDAGLVTDWYRDNVRREASLGLGDMDLEFRIYAFLALVYYDLRETQVLPQYLETIALFKQYIHNTLEVMDTTQQIPQTQVAVILNLYTLFIQNALSSRILVPAPVDGRNSYFEISPDGTRLLYSGNGNRPVQVWDVEAGEKLDEYSGGQRAHFTASGIAYIAADFKAILLPEGKRTPIQNPSGRGNIKDFIFKPGSVETLLIARHDEDTILHNTRTGRMFLTDVNVSSQSSLSKDANIIVSVFDGVQQVHVDRKPFLHERSFDEDRLHDIDNLEPSGYPAISPDGKFFAFGLRGGRVSLRDTLDENKRPKVFNLHEGEVRDITFSPDGKFLLTSGQDGWIRLVDIQTKAVVGSLNVEQPILQVHVLPGGRRLAVQTESGEIRIWETTRTFPQIVVRSESRTLSDEDLIADNRIQIHQQESSEAHYTSRVETARAADGTVSLTLRDTNPALYKQIIEEVVPALAREIKIDQDALAASLTEWGDLLHLLVQNKKFGDGKGAVLLTTQGEKDRVALLRAAIALLPNVIGIDPKTGKPLQQLVLIDSTAGLKNQVLTRDLGAEALGMASQVMQFVRPDEIGMEITRLERSGRSVAASVTEGESEALSAVLANIVRASEDVSEIQGIKDPAKLAELAAAYLSRDLLLIDLAAYLKINAAKLKTQPQIAAAIRNFFTERLPDVVVTVGNDGSFNLPLRTMVYQLSAWKAAKTQLEYSA